MPRSNEYRLGDQLEAVTQGIEVWSALGHQPVGLHSHQAACCGRTIKVGVNERLRLPRLTSDVPTNPADILPSQKLTKILANFSLHLTSVFNGFVLITPTEIYSSSTRTLYDNQASKNVGALVDAGGGVDAPFLFSFNI